MADLVRKNAKDDDGLADLLIGAGIADDVRFDHSTDNWLIWNGVRWRPDDATRIFYIVRTYADVLWADARRQDDDEEGEEEDGNAKRQRVMQLYMQGRKKAVLEALKAKPEIAVHSRDFDQDPFLMGFENGVLDLRTMEFEEHPAKDLYITKSTRIAWDPEATCPTFDAFVADIMGGNEELVLYLMTLLGYSMFGLQSEQKFWMWVGRGANGKGVLARTVLRTLGDYAYAPDAALYMKTRAGAAHAGAARPELVKLHGVRYTYMSEPPGRQFDEQLIKAHTGEDVIVAREVYGKSSQMLEFPPTHTILVLTNDPPKTEDVGVSMKRRVRIVKFEQDYTGPRADLLLEERLKGERPGIARRLAQFAKLWYQNGLPEPKAVTDWSKEYIEDNDPLTAFLEEACVQDPTKRGNAAILWAAYEQWAIRQGNQTDMLSRARFGVLMAGRFTRVKARDANYYVGVYPKEVGNA